MNCTGPQRVDVGAEPGFTSCLRQPELRLMLNAQTLFHECRGRVKHRNASCVFRRYLVERRWYEQWKDFVETGDQNSSSFPGQIDNTELFEGQLRLKPVLSDLFSGRRR